MLSSDKLADELETAWTVSDADVENLTESGQIIKMGEAIGKYLEDAAVSLTGSGITFPALESFKTLLVFDGTINTAALNIESSLVAALTGAVGNIDGTPVAPGTSIVSEIAAPPIPGVCNAALILAFDNTGGTLRGQMELIAAAIHGLVLTIVFIVTQMMPGTPPVPTPVPGVPIS